MLASGAKAPLNGTAPYTVVVTYGQGGPVVNLTAFMLGANDRVRSDDDMVFYGQNLRAAQGAEWLEPVTQGGTTTLTLAVNPWLWPADITRVRIGLTTDGDVAFSQVADLQANVVDATGAVMATFDLSKRGTENAFIVADIYKRNDMLKVHCQAAGFTSGLAGLCGDVGVVVDDKTATAAAMSYIAQLAAAPLPQNAPAIDFRKKALAVVLVESKLDNTVFRVVLVIDASGSMAGLYKAMQDRPSVVQCSLERMVTIADLLDNGPMKVWYFGTHPSASEPVTVATMEGYIARTWENKKRAGVYNDEPKVMRVVIDWVKDHPSKYKTIVLFWSDGGVGNQAAIERLLVESSVLDIFWMFLGLGGKPSMYGVLTDLDNVKGGAVDNAGFVHLDNIEGMSDDDLYAAIFAHVSKWNAEYDQAVAAGRITPPAL